MQQPTAITPQGLYWRQLDILAPKDVEHVKVTLIGCGGIGSPTALVLAKMGLPSIKMYDGDKVEEHNLPNQLLPMLYADIQEEGGEWFGNIERYKVFALRDLLNTMARGDFESNPLYWSGQFLEGIVISAVDSMKVRKEIWQGVKHDAQFIDLYIDGRMGAEVGAVYAFDPKDAHAAKVYEDHCLYADADALDEPCTARAIIYNTFMLAALIGRQVKQHLTGGRVPREIIMDIGNLGMLVEEPNG